MGRKEKMSPERKEFIQQFLAQNDIRSAHDIEIALRDMMKETLQTMLENELTEKLNIPVKVIIYSDFSTKKLPNRRDI